MKFQTFILQSYQLELSITNILFICFISVLVSQQSFTDLVAVLIQVLCIFSNTILAYRVKQAECPIDDNVIGCLDNN